MDSISIRKTVAALSSQEREQWLKLFQECYRKGRDAAEAIFRKYEMHGQDAWFCIAIQDDCIVACYSGVILPFGSSRIFLATDTMSNGQLRNATVKLAEVLYGHLKEAGVDAVCGFPNGNIIRIRERRLGWKITGQLNAYIGVPLLWRLGRRPQTGDPTLWDLARPKEGFFARRRIFIRLLGRHGLYSGTTCSAVLTLSAQSPGPFFIRIPQAFAAPKMFGWVLTNQGNTELAASLQAASGKLDLNTIDVP